MSHLRLLIGLLAVSAFAGDAKLDDLLHQVEARYNKTKSLQVLFKEDYIRPGETRRPTENGLLMLRKPGRMRWDYSQPKGKLCVFDSKYLWVYTPSDNHVEKVKYEDTPDMRVPLAFLLGRLNFDKEFRNVQAKPEGADTRLIAEPKSDNLPYSEVQFVVTPDFRIRAVKVTGFDKSILEFAFDQERQNPPLDAKLFQFEVPKGAELVESGQ